MAKKSSKKMPWVTSTFFGETVDESTTDDIEYLSSKVANDSGRLWSEEFPPKRQEDLAVNKKKVLEVSKWIENSLQKKMSKILLLTGPSGCGKTATIKVICRALNIDVREWKNGSTEKYDKGASEFVPSQSELFYDFLLRGSKYKSVCGVGAGNCNSLLLIEELPNIYMHDPSEFHPMLKKFRQLSSTNPAVFVLSESSGNDQLTKKLFPPELFVDNISFNPVSATLLDQALNRIMKLKSGTTEKYSMSKELTTRIGDGSNGDIRGAINSLQFLLKKGSIHPDSKKITGSRKRKKTVEESLPTDLSGIGMKDSNLILFRSLGKVLYCKRRPELPPCFLEPHLKEHQRIPLLENPENIIDRTPIDNKGSFALFLHHNGPTFFNDIHLYATAMSYLSDADIVGSYWTPGDELQSYAASVAVRGFMFNRIKKVNNKFQPLTGPSWFAHSKSIAERKTQVRMLHRINKTMNDAEITTNVIPFLAKINSPHQPTQTKKFHEELGLFYNERREFVKHSSDIPCPAFINNDEILSSADLSDPEEDFLIEEIIE